MRSLLTLLAAFIVLLNCALPASATETRESQVEPFTSHFRVASLPVQPTAAWEPTETTRILITHQRLRDDAVADDVNPTLLRDGQRFAGEVAATGILSQPPGVLFGASEAVDSDSSANDIVLALDGDAADTTSLSGAERPAATITVDGTSGVEIRSDSLTGVFAATRAVLQHLNAHGELPVGEHELTTAAETRSVHIDVARKHYSLDALKQLLLDMSWVGMNELELHFSENEGFRIESERYPEIATDDAYTKDEIRELIEFAADLHIRITPSLDMPGHLEHVLQQFPEYRLHAASGQAVYGALDITNSKAREFAFDLIDEYTELFEPGRWNLGADEFVNFNNHDQVAALTSYAQAQIGPNATASDALTAFVNEVDLRLQEAGFSTRVWSDGMLKGEPEPVEWLNTEIEVGYWTTRPPGAASIDRFARNGVTLLNVNDEFLYFVLGERVEYYYPSGEEILASWSAQTFPSLQGQPQMAAADANVSGGMFAIWSDIPEALSDNEVVERVRMPIAATAWKLHQPNRPPSWQEFQARAEQVGRPESPEFGAIEARPLRPEATATPTSFAASESAGEGQPALLWGAGLVLGIAAVAGTLLLRRRRH